MIVPDVNLLLYAHVTAFPEHARARKWWEGALNGGREVGLAGPALFGFVRLATHPRVFDEPLPVERALAFAEEWLARPRVRFVQPGPRHLEIAFGLLRQTAVHWPRLVRLRRAGPQHEAASEMIFRSRTL